MSKLPDRVAHAGWWERAKYRRGRRALERQLDYQRSKAQKLGGHEEELVRLNFVRAQQVRSRLESIKPIATTDKILEVGSGVTGLVFNLPGAFAVGVDPLADEYKKLFPKVQRGTQTITAIGEELPFDDGAFDIVLSDNVIDHAERPLSILDEIVRVLKPGGLLFFTVNIHHPFYNLASDLHGIWNAAGLHLELSAFADHTIHLTHDRISSEFRRFPMEIVEERSSVAETRSVQRRERGLRPEALLRKAFFKNALFELVAIKKPLA